MSLLTKLKNGQKYTRTIVDQFRSMFCIIMYSFENQSSQVQLITLKATYLPNIL